MKKNFNPVRGCIDFAPMEAEQRQIAIDVILKTYKDNGFLLIKTPILENLDLLEKNDSGENSTKLTFKTIKRGEKLNLDKPNLTEKDIVEEGLRYDLTVPLSRFFANNKSNLTFPFKSIQIDESFRAERPQKGRFRQFTQADIDILGEATILGEIEIISTVMAVYKNLGLQNLIVKINNRKILEEVALKAGFETNQVNDICIIVDKIDKIGLDGVQYELLLKNFNKEKTQKFCNLLSNIRNQGLIFLKQQNIALEELEKMQELISIVKANIASDYEIVFDIGIVRGQSYYTGTVFEVFQKQGEYKGALCGGGRFDNMMKEMTGENVPAIGVGLGLDTTLLVLKEQQITLEKPKKKIALLYEDTTNLKNLMKAKQDFMSTYEVALMPQIKNHKEMERKLKLNNFDGFATIENQQIRWL